jgi:hypothetical protein
MNVSFSATASLFVVNLRHPHGRERPEMERGLIEGRRRSMPSLRLFDQK